MAIDSTLDFDALLAPCSGDNPAGEDLRADADYHKVKDAHKSARAAERGQVYGAETADQELAHIPEWRVIVSVAPKLIANRSKSLELACWLTCGLVREFGFAGLRDGVRLIGGLVQNYWDGLYPLEDEDGLDTKLGPLVGLLGKGGDSPLCLALRKIPITNSDGGGFGYLASWHYDVANSRTAAGKEGEGVLTLGVFKKVFEQNSAAFLRELIDDMTATLEHLDALSRALIERCGAQAPSVASLRDVVQQIMGLVRTLGASKLAVPEEGGSTQGAGVDVKRGEEITTTRSNSVPTGAIQSRDQALKLLLDVATFFRRTEPQSFVPVMLENVVRRSRLSLFDLLLDLVPDVDRRRELLVRAGISDSDHTDKLTSD